jgi:hypothetical protein
MQKQRKISFELMRPFLYSSSDVRNLLLAARDEFRNNRAWLESAVTFHDDESLRSILLILKGLFLAVGEPVAGDRCQRLYAGVDVTADAFELSMYADLFVFLDAIVVELALESSIGYRV